MSEHLEDPQSGSGETRRPMWQISLLFVALWPLLYFGLAAMFPGVRTDHQGVAMFFFLALTALLAGRIAWIFR